MSRMDEKKENHESFGMLQISRRTCTPPINVFGSSVKTSNPIHLTITTATKYRSLNRHWFHSNKELIEIYMSPAQFSDAITSLNAGSGTPVTIDHVGGEKMAECPEVDQRQLFEDEFDKDMKNIAKELSELTDLAEKLLTAKGTLKSADKKSLLSRIRSAEQNVRADVPFVYSQFNTAMDKTTSEAKAEIESFVTNSIMSAGIDVLGLKKPKLIGDK